MSSTQLDVRQEATDTWSILLRIIDELGAARCLEDVSRVVAANARALVGADGVTFVLREGEQCHYLEENAIGPLWRGLRFPMSACISGWCMLNRQTASVPDILVDPRIPQDAYLPTFVRSLVMVPVGTPTPFASIGAYWARRKEHDPQSRRILETLARSTAATIMNLKLQQRIAQNRERMMVALEAANFGSWELDLDELVLSTSMVCKSQFGRQPNEKFSYADLMNCAHAGGRNELQAAMSALASRGGQFELTMRVDWPDGTTRRLQLQGYAESDVNARATRIVGFSRDVT